MSPQRCSVIPYIGPSSGHRFIDTGQDIDQFHRLYISEPAAREMAEMVGMVPRGELKQAQAEITRLLAEREQLKAEVRELERVTQAIDVLESKDFRARKKPGRPKTEVAG